MNDDGPRDPGAFADMPESITEARSRLEKNMRVWTPRDVLINLLRDIDSGALNLDAIIVGYRTLPTADSKRITGHAKCAPDMYDLIALAGIVHQDLVLQFKGMA